MGCSASVPAVEPPAASKETPKPSPAPAAAPAPAPAAVEPAKEEKAPEPAAPATTEPAPEPVAAEPAAVPAAEPVVAAAAADAGAPKPALIIMGPPSSGKGSLIAKVVTNFKLHHIKESWLIKQATELNIAGADATDMKADDQMCKLLVALMEHHAGAAGYVLDGLPKTAAQAELLKGCAVKVIQVDVSEADILDMHANRVVDPEGGKMYCKKTNPPPEGEIADRCVPRDADAEDKVKELIAPYFAELAGIAAAFGDKVLKVPGTTKSGGEEETAMYDAVCKECGLA